MTGAMYAAVSGLKAHMQKLNVIGNNVANVNTYGYKAARATFQESLYTTITSGSNGSDSVGGVNPAQLGYGCNIGTIDLNMSTANYVPTGKSLDCMIDGDGFFLVGDKAAGSTGTDGIVLDETNAKDLLLTRVGNFEIDPQGYLTDGQGNVVYGFVTTSGDTTAGALVDADNPTASTQLVPIRLPLAAKTDGSAVYPGVDTDGHNVYDPGTDSADLTDGSTITTDSISIDASTGKITAVNKADKSTIVVGYIPLANVTNPNGVTHIQGAYYRAGEGAGDCSVASIGDVLSGKYLNNKASGDTDAVAIRGTGSTDLITSGLESSGTDLATEISEMITTQRGYQANTRIITVTDSMLEELVNMKR
ncbi:MAG: flagellar hook-basal body complex protein [Intestinimonas sp.]|jgi:flagellar hook protein FlgE|nr:flagellar hook-basal body complex protein [Intestinimonas sp.]